MTYKIEKNIPFEHAVSTRSSYPLAALDIGDSFLVADMMQRQVVRSSAYMFGRRYNRKFKTKAVDGGVRVWRIA